jgi:hypothetical protein
MVGGGVHHNNLFDVDVVQIHQIDTAVPDFPRYAPAVSTRRIPAMAVALIAVNSKVA